MSTMVNNDINTGVVSNDVLDVLKMQVGVGRKVELKNQEMKSIRRLNARRGYEYSQGILTRKNIKSI